MHRKRVLVAFGRRVDMTRTPSLSEVLRVVAAFVVSLFPEFHRRPVPHVPHPAVTRLGNLRKVW